MVEKRVGGLKKIKLNLPPPYQKNPRRVMGGARYRPADIASDRRRLLAMGGVRYRPAEIASDRPRLLAMGGARYRPAEIANDRPRMLAMGGVRYRPALDNTFVFKKWII